MAGQMTQQPINSRENGALPVDKRASDACPKNRNHVILANQPRLFREMLRVVLDRTPGLHVVADSNQLQDLEAIFQQTQVEWLVVTLGADGQTPEDAQTLLNEQRVDAILAISLDGSNLVMISRLGPGQYLRQPLHNISLHQLLSLLNHAGSASLTA
jgi:hypothetical protein